MNPFFDDSTRETIDGILRSEEIREEMTDQIIRDFHERVQRERDAHQAVILTLQKQEEALQKQTDALEVQIKTLEAQKQGNRLTVLTGILVAILGYVLGLLTPYLK